MDARPLGMMSWMNSVLKVPGGLNPLEALGLWVRLSPHQDPALQILQPLFPGLLPAASDGSGALEQSSFVFHLFSPISFHPVLHFKWEVKLVPVTPSWLEAKVVSRGFELLPALLHCHLCTEQVPFLLCTS